MSETTTTKLTKSQKETILNNPKVIAFNDQVNALENAGRLASVKIACAVYEADHNGTTAAMGLDTAAQFLIQVRGYSKAQAMNLQRVGKFTKGAVLMDKNGNTYGVSHIVQALESATDEKQAMQLLTDGTLNALQSVKAIKKAITALNKPAIAATAESKDVTDTETPTNTETPANTETPTDTTPADVYNIDCAVIAPDGKGGSVTVKSENFNGKLDVIKSHVERFLKLATAPGAKVVVSVQNRK